MLFNSINEAKNYSFPIIDYSVLEKLLRQENKDQLRRFVTLGNQVSVTSEMREWYQGITNNDTNETSDKAIMNKYKQEQKKLVTKVNNYSERWGFEPEYVQYLLGTLNENLLIQFATDPKRQTVHQHYAAEWITENIPFVQKVIEPPNQGPNAYYIDNGIIRMGTETANIETPKSIDFIWEYRLCGKTLTFYVTHKYTETNGGHQDEQFADVASFLDQARDCIDNDIFILAILDGAYYQSRYTKVKNSSETKIGYLNDKYVGKRNKATCSNDLTKDYLPVLREWIKTTFPNQYGSNLKIKRELELINAVLPQVDNP